MNFIQKQIQQSSNNPGTEKQKAYFLVLEISIPLIVVNISHKGPAEVISSVM